ncbi:MAG: DoxX family protein [Kangiellaceae bacterium]
MKIAFYILLVLLVLLAVLSGITKILLMPQEVEFFGPFGFSNSLLITFGAVQLLGGVILAIPRIRKIGAAVIAITFLISAVVLFLSGNIPMAIVTLVFIGLLGFVVKYNVRFYQV